LLGRWECPPGRLSRWKALMVVVGPVRRAGLALSAIVEGCDNVLRQWPTACISLLTLAALFGASMLLSF
jgi:multicomponent Na+:H+ antiporter subunit D